MADLDDLGVSPTIHRSSLSRRLYYMWRYIFIKAQYIGFVTFGVEISNLVIYQGP